MGTETRPSVDTAGGRVPATPTFSVKSDGSVDVNLADLKTSIDNLTAAMTATAPNLPPKARMPLTDANAPDMVPVNFTSATPQTIENADATKAWSVYGWLLSFSAACTLTIEGGSEDLVIDINAAGLWDLADRELAITTANVNQAMTLTVSAGTCKGALYMKKA